MLRGAFLFSALGVQMLTWKELQEQAKKIVANTPQGEFIDKSFTTGSGGSPQNEANIPEIHRSDTAQYRTVRHGWAYAGEVIIRCRHTDTKDANGRTIYEAKSGHLFVYEYQQGAAEYFDNGSLSTPQLPA
jgi:hypothetical protein